MFLLNPWLHKLFYAIHSVFTFHYVSIKSAVPGLSTLGITLFTFHYVSIKSELAWSGKRNHTNLHSTMFLLNPKPFCLCPQSTWGNLHSTMFLLNPSTTVITTWKWHFHLHSTMFLLNPLRYCVIINTCQNLHSTMFLLNLLAGLQANHSDELFTFHYVSIKSWQRI